MDFHAVGNDMVKQLMPAIKQVVEMGVGVSEQRMLLERLFRSVGSAFYLQLFEANSYVFDSLALGTVGWDELDLVISKLSRTVVTNAATGIDYEQQVQSFFNSGLGKAQAEAFQNGVSLGKHPTLTRTTTGKEDCAFCKSVEGTHVYPEGKYFARCCSNCNCLIVVSGYNSRNGIVNNYAKKKGAK